MIEVFLNSVSTVKKDQIDLFKKELSEIGKG